MRARATVSCSLPGMSLKPGASTRMICGMKSSPMTVRMRSQKARTAMVCSAKSRAGSGPSVA